MCVCIHLYVCTRPCAGRRCSATVALEAAGSVVWCAPVHASGMAPVLPRPDGEGLRPRHFGERRMGNRTNVITILLGEGGLDGQSGRRSTRRGSLCDHPGRRCWQSGKCVQDSHRVVYSVGGRTEPCRLGLLQPGPARPRGCRLHRRTQRSQQPLGSTQRPILSGSAAAARWPRALGPCAGGRGRCADGLGRMPRRGRGPMV